MLIAYLGIDMATLIRCSELCCFRASDVRGILSTLRFPNLVIDQYHNSVNVPCTVIRSTSTISRNKLLTSGNTLHVSRAHFLLFPANDEAVSQPGSTCNIGKTRLFRGPSVDKCKYLSCLLQRISLQRSLPSVLGSLCGEIAPTVTVGAISLWH